MGNAREFDQIAREAFHSSYCKIVEQILAKIQVKEGMLLDAGCGGGHLGFSLMEHIKGTTVFLDRNENAISIAKERAQEKGLEKRCCFCVAQVESIPFPEETFDLIVSRNSIPFWREQEKAIKELYRVLKPEGELYMGCGYGGKEIKKKVWKEIEQKGIFCQRSRKVHESYLLSVQEYKAILEQLNGVYTIAYDGKKELWIHLKKRNGKK